MVMVEAIWVNESKFFFGKKRFDLDWNKGHPSETSPVLNRRLPMIRCGLQRGEMED